MQVLYLTESTMLSNTLNLRNIHSDDLLYGIIVADTATLTLNNVIIDNIRQT